MTEKERFLELVERTSRGFDNADSWRKHAEWRRENRAWLRVSGKIAVNVLTAIGRIPGMSKEVLAEKTGLGIDYINRIVKGGEDLTISVIMKLEEVLGVILIGEDRRS